MIDEGDDVAVHPEQAENVELEFGLHGVGRIRVDELHRKFEAVGLATRTWTRARVPVALSIRSLPEAAVGGGRRGLGKGGMPGAVPWRVARRL